MRMTMTVPEMAEALGIGRNNAYNLVKEPSFPVLKIGRQLRIPKQAFEAWVNHHSGQPMNKKNEL